MSGTEDEEDNKGEKLDKIEEEDEVASNTAEAGSEENPVVVNLETTEDPTKVESNLPSAFMAEDDTIKVEETRQEDPVDEAIYLLDLFADENAKYLDKIINRRKGQNVRYIWLSCKPAKGQPTSGSQKRNLCVAKIVGINTLSIKQNMHRNGCQIFQFRARTEKYKIKIEKQNMHPNGCQNFQFRARTEK
jgi:hypothetical protein